ncbi:MAG: four helix bundle protein [Bacteroidetes bacterium]|nr:four helix bundle protein [Bacteroidota bacterium]
MTNAEFAEYFKNRTKKFALNIIKNFQKLPKTDEARIIGKQLLRSATSTAANYRAVCRARSDAEFFSKLSIVVEEADESVFWLEILLESEIIIDSEISNTKSLLKEANEILSVVSSSRKTMRNG